MNKSNTNSYFLHSTHERITLKEFFLKIGEWSMYLLNRWLLLLVFALIGAALGFLYTHFKKPQYLARTTFVLFESNSANGGALAQYASIAALAGINLGQGDGDIFEGDNIVELYKSRLMIEKTLLSEVEINGKRQLLIDRYLDYNNLREKWIKNAAPLQFSAHTQAHFSRLQDSVLGLAVKDINKNYLYVGKPDPQLSIIKAEVKSSDEAFAKLFNDQLVKNVNDFYIQSKTKKSTENLAILQHQTDSVKAVMEQAVYSQASTLDATAYLNPTRQVLRTSISRGLISIETNKAILSELIKNLEMTKMSLLKETPLIQVIDRPVTPLENSNLSRKAGTAIGLTLFLFIGILYLLIKKIVTD